MSMKEQEGKRGRCLTSNAFTRLIVSIGVIIWISAAAASVAAAAGSQQQRKIAINLPDIRPDHAEQYLCMAHRLPVDTDGEFIVAFNPKGDVSRVHHMLLYGCQRPGIFQRDSPNFVWDCGAMHTSTNSDQQPSFEMGPVCTGKQHILYGWALDAPALKLPKGVGFQVGGVQSDIQFLILQVHYGHYHAFQQLPDLTDNSGLTLEMRANVPESGITKRAGVLLLVSLGQVQRGESRHEIFCDIEEDIEIHPFRYRVHTHKLGTKVLGAKLGAKNKAVSKSEKYGRAADDRIIGTGDPQKPQMFYPVKEKDMTIGKGDSVYAYCEFNNNKSHIVNIGPTGDDEMCNFYLMYWTDSTNLLMKDNCVSRNGLSLISRLLQ